jgi:hypothetical protein
MILPQYRFHGAGDNTSHYLGPKCNNNAYGAPEPSLEGDEIPFDWEGEKKDDLGVDNCAPLQ